VPKDTLQPPEQLKKVKKVQSLTPSTTYFLAGGFVLNLRNYSMFFKERNKIVEG